MGRTTFKLEDKFHNYFVSTAYRILSEIGVSITPQDIEDEVLSSGYMLCILSNRTNSKWNVGIWAVGEWNIKSQYDGGEPYKDGYGVQTYQPYTISVFVVHDWTYDKFRPTYSDREITIPFKNEMLILNTVKEMKEIIKNPIDSYYDNIDVDLYQQHHLHSNKYKAYAIGYWKNEIVPFFEKWTRRRIGGYLTSKLIKTVAKLDRRVAYVAVSFHNDEWNNEYDVAIVFKYNKKQYKEWKVFNFYDRFPRTNVTLAMSYLDKWGNFPSSVWRGVYWETIPEKDE